MPAKRVRAEVHEQVLLSEVVTVHRPRNVPVPVALEIAKRLKEGWQVERIDITFTRWADVRVKL